MRRTFIINIIPHNIGIFFRLYVVLIILAVLNNVLNVKYIIIVWNEMQPFLLHCFNKLSVISCWQNASFTIY